MLPHDAVLSSHLQLFYKTRTQLVTSLLPSEPHMDVSVDKQLALIAKPAEGRQQTAHVRLGGAALEGCRVCARSCIDESDGNVQNEKNNLCSAY